MSFLKKLGDAANKAKDVANTTVQAANEQIQANKKVCPTCGDKIGFLTVYCELSSGERVCSKCLEALGLSLKQYTDSAFKEGFLAMSLEDVQQAIAGDKDKLEHIHSLSSAGVVDEEINEDGGDYGTEQSEELFGIILVEAKEKLLFVDTMCGLTEHSDDELEELAENVPSVIFGYQAYDEAFELKSLLEGVDAVIEIVPMSDAKMAEYVESTEVEVKAENTKASIIAMRETKFKATKSFLEYIEFDDTNKWWRVKRVYKDYRQEYEYHEYSEVIDVELSHDISEKTTTKQNWGTLNYLIGDTMGALTEGSTSTTKKTINSCMILVTTDSVAEPTVYVPFAGNIAEIAEQCLAVFKIIKSNNERSNATSAQQAAPVINQVSAADELIKFKGLLDAGVLTQEEFDKKKAELLNL